MGNMTGDHRGYEYDYDYENRLIRIEKRGDGGDPDTVAQFEYDALGRFISRDPIGYSGGLNLYEYVGSMSTILFDPYGFFGYDMHHDMVYIIMSQFCPDIAEAVANASQGADEGLHGRARFWAEFKVKIARLRCAPDGSG